MDQPRADPAGTTAARNDGARRGKSRRRGGIRFRDGDAPTFWRDCRNHPACLPAGVWLRPIARQNALTIRISSIFLRRIIGSVLKLPRRLLQLRAVYDAAVSAADVAD